MCCGKPTNYSKTRFIYSPFHHNTLEIPNYRSAFWHYKNTVSVLHQSSGNKPPTYQVGSQVVVGPTCTEQRVGGVPWWRQNSFTIYNVNINESSSSSSF